MFTCCCGIDTENIEEKIPNNNNNINITNKPLSGIEMYRQYSITLSRQSPPLTRVNSIESSPSTYNGSPNSPIFTKDNLTPESFQRELNVIFTKTNYIEYTEKQKSTFNNLKDSI
jgi:hypothetical protein